jgi:hypothetical protein
MTEDRLGDYEVGSAPRMALSVLAHTWTLLIGLCEPARGWCGHKT